MSLIKVASVYNATQTLVNQPASAAGAPAPAPSLDPSGTQISPAKMSALLTALQQLLNHTHIYYDDYGTACNCNCNCNCTRGTL